MSNATSFTNVGKLNVRSLENNLIILWCIGLKQENGAPPLKTGFPCSKTGAKIVNPCERKTTTLSNYDRVAVCSNSRSNFTDCKYCLIKLLFTLTFSEIGKPTYLLTYAYSPTRGMGHRQQHANGFGPGPVSQLGSNCSLSLNSLPLGPFSKCSWIYPSFSFPGGSRSGPGVYI